MTSPLPTAHLPTVHLFDEWARRGRAEGMEEGHLPRAREALAAVPVGEGDRVLDLGCGNGWATRHLRARAGASGSAVGLDASEAMVARATAASEGVAGVRFVRAAFESLPWGANSFEHAFSFEALYYSVDIDAALAAVRGVLVAGGTLTVGTDFYAENPGCHDWPDRLGIPMELMTEQGWADRIEAAGFEVLRRFRCLDPRPVDPSLPAVEREATRRFREEIGSLALVSRVVG